MANIAITKRVIHAGFTELLNERPLSKITVKDITDRCGISRNTFYYHYQDIPALLEEMCFEQTRRIIRQHSSPDSLEACLESAMQFARENRRAIRNIYASDNRNIYVNCLWRICEQMVTTYINTAFADAPLSPEDKSLIIRYHKCQCFGLIIDWIGGGMKEEYSQGIRRLCWLLRGSTEEMIRRSQLSVTEE